MKKLLSAYRDYGLARFFLPLGILLIIFGIVFFASLDKTKSYKKTEAIVTKTELFEEEHDDGDTHYDASYDVYVKYTVNEKNYEEYYGIFSNLEEGEMTTIAYDPKDPTQIAQPISVIEPIAMFIGGAAAHVFGIISAINTNKKDN